MLAGRDFAAPERFHRLGPGVDKVALDIPKSVIPMKTPAFDPACVDKLTVCGGRQWHLKTLSETMNRFEVLQKIFRLRG
jgi:hypothetical protein